MKFKIGDRVKVVKCKISGERCENINKISTITQVEKDMPYPYMLKDLYEAFSEDELELVQEKQFTKSDLKDGDIVTYRDGNKRTLINGFLINDVGYISKEIKSYTNELKNATLLSGAGLDIVKVERPVKYETVFEEKEEILDEAEKKYLADVVRPFKNKVQYIVKYNNPLRTKKEYLRIKLINDEEMNFPDFKKDSMYKGMKEGKKYTLKKLGL